MKIFSVVVAFQWSKGNFCLLEIEKKSGYYQVWWYKLLISALCKFSGWKDCWSRWDPSYAKLTSNLQCFCKQNFRRPSSFMSKISFWENWPKDKISCDALLKTCVKDLRQTPCKQRPETIIETRLELHTVWRVLFWNIWILYCIVFLISLLKWM